MDVPVPQMLIRTSPVSRKNRGQDWRWLHAKLSLWNIDIQPIGIKIPYDCNWINNNHESDSDSPIDSFPDFYTPLSLPYFFEV